MNALTRFASALKSLVNRPNLGKANQQTGSGSRALSFGPESKRVQTNSNIPKFPEGTLAALHQQLSQKKSA